MSLARGGWLGFARAVLAGAALLAPGVSGAAEEPRFDLRDWSRRSGGETIRLDCQAAERCGKEAILSARLRPRPAQLPTLEGQRKREEELAARMRKQNAERIKDIVLGETKEIRFDNVQGVQTERRVIDKDEGVRIFVDGILVGPSHAYTLVASAPTPELARANFESFARTLALVLDQLSYHAPRPPLRR